MVMLMEPIHPLLCVKEMEQSFNQLSENNVQLRKEHAEVGALLGRATAQKALLEKEVEELKSAANSSARLHGAGQKKLVRPGWISGSWRNISPRRMCLYTGLVTLVISRIPSTRICIL